MVNPTRIREARGARTQRDFAVELGTDQMNVSRWERGQSEPSLASLRALAELTGHPMEWFFNHDENEAA